MRKIIGCVAVAAVAIGVIVYMGVPARAESPFAGKWKASLLQGVNQGTFWLVEVEEKDGKLSGAKVVSGAGPAFRETKLKDFKADDKEMTFTLAAAPGEFEASVRAPGGKGPAKTLLGTLRFRGMIFPLRLEATEDKEIDAAKAEQVMDGAGDLRAALTEKKGAERVKAVEAFLKENADKPIALFGSSILFRVLVEDKAKGEALRAAADQFIQQSGKYGTGLERQAAMDVIEGLLGAKEAAVAVDYARKAAKALPDDAPPAEQLNVLEGLTTSLKQAGKEDEAKDLAPRIAKLNDTLDEEFLKTNIPFEPLKFGGREGKSEHVAVVELFTGAQCPLCVAADVAFDAALKTYPSKDVVLLQYHLHIPGPDLLTSPASLKRAEYYDVEGRPSTYVDGKVTSGLGGGRGNAKASYNTLHKAVAEALESEDQAKLSVKATRDGDKISLSAEVQNLKKTGEKVRLRFVLVEDVVRYPGRNGQRLHHHVIRDMPGGVEGFALKEATAKHTATVSLGELRKELEKYLKDASFGRLKPFAEEGNLRVTLKDLKVVALIQDDETKQILQAAQVAVPSP